jgi:glycosyltransferase involved in cell wall biosynthesis
MSSISILIPCLNEEKYIDDCIESIVASNFQNYEKEIIFIDGGSSDNTVKVIGNYQKTHPFIKLLHNPKKFTPVSMNMGLEASSGDYIFIVSAHAKYESSYFSKLVKHIKELNANCVGGVLKTEVKNSNKKSNSIKEIFTHKFGVGNADFRTGSDKIKEVDTVAFGCYSKETFKKYGLYDERLLRNQDIELNKRIVNGGGKIYLIPDIAATYYARENFTELAQNNFSNGKWNILTAYYTKTLNSLSLRHFIPLIFVLSLIVPILLSFININFLWITLLSLGSYLALVIIASLKSIDSKNSFFYVIISFLTLHLSYGFGSLVGVLSLLKKVIKGIQ